jgi:hypothetical protein
MLDSVGDGGVYRRGRNAGRLREDGSAERDGGEQRQRSVAGVVPHGGASSANDGEMVFSIILRRAIRPLPMRKSTVSSPDEPKIERFSATKLLRRPYRCRVSIRVSEERRNPFEVFVVLLPEPY